MTSRLAGVCALVLALPAIAAAEEDHPSSPPAAPDGGAGALGDPRPTGATPGEPAPSEPSPEAASPEPATGASLAGALGDPRAGASPRSAPPTPPEATEPPGAGAEPWEGPRVELGYTHFAIVDGFGGGDVHAGFFGGYLPTRRLRLGGSAELGARDYSLGQSDALLRASIVAGYQHLETRPFVPYAVAVGTAGILLTKRFRTPGSDAIFGAGLEVGADLNLYRTLYVGVGLSYQRASVGGVGHDLWVIRLRIGL